MGLETGTYVNDLNASNPVGASDPKSQGDDHIRLVKSTILASFPNIGGEVSLTHTQINDAARQGNENTFTENQIISHTSPRMIWVDTNAGSDEKNWDWWVNSGSFTLRTRTDADGAGESPIILTRTGTGVDSVVIEATSVRLAAATALRAYNSGDSQYASLAMGTHGAIATTSGNLQISPAGLFADFMAGTTVRAYDASGSDHMYIKETGSQAQIVSNANNIYIYSQLTEVMQLAPNSVQVRSGASLRVYDSGNTDYRTESHNGTDFNSAFVNTLDWNISNVDYIKIFKSSGSGDGPIMRLYGDSTSDYFEWKHDGTRVQLSGVNTTDITNALPVASPNLSASEWGFKGAPQRVQNGDYTLLLADAGKQIYKASGGAGETITIPANSSVAFPIGTIIEIINDGGDDLSIAITSDTLEKYGSTTGTQTLTDNNKAVIEKVAATLWKYASSD